MSGRKTLWVMSAVRTLRLFSLWSYWWRLQSSTRSLIPEAMTTITRGRATVGRPFVFVTVGITYASRKILLFFAGIKSAKATTYLEHAKH